MKDDLIKNAIEGYLNQGIKDKHVIYSKVVQDLGVCRPLVRRMARDLRNEYLAKVKILQSDLHA